MDWEIELNSKSQNVETLTINVKENETDLSANFIAGIDTNLFDKISAGVRYQYLWTNTGTVVSDDVTAHIAPTSIRIRFYPAISFSES